MLIYIYYSEALEIKSAQVSKHHLLEFYITLTDFSWYHGNMNSEKGKKK